MLDLKKRQREPEIMDQPGLDERRHVRALTGLARMNLLSRVAATMWPPIVTVLQQTGRASLLDVATGGGDTPVRLFLWAHRAKFDLQVAGCDVSDRAIAYAKSQAERKGAKVNFFTWKALQDPLPPAVDIVTCSLFLHHLSDDDAVMLFSRLARVARRLLLINDLARGRVGYVLALAATRLLTTSRVVHYDGPLSVRAAFTPQEALALAHRAGLETASVVRRWPCRYLLSWSPCLLHRLGQPGTRTRDTAETGS